MNIFLFGINHKSAPVEIREQVSFTKEEVFSALEKTKQIPDIKESMILSTCNRTEIYALLEPTADGMQKIKELLLSTQKWNENIDSSHYYIMYNDEAIHHLFKVTSGMDSMVLGEPQIQGQVKDAFEMALELKTARSIFSRLYQSAMIAGKRVRSETNIAKGAVSVAYAASELAEKIFRSLKDKSALLIGAGETGELTALHLKEKGIRHLYITNRTFEKAESLAQKLDGQAVPFDQFYTLLTEVDVVISSTGSADPIVTLNNAAQFLNKKTSPIFFIDIAVPRDIDPAIGKLENVFLHNIDSLNQIIEKNLEKRRAEIPNAEKILAEEVQNFLKWYDSLSLKPFIKDLKEYLENLRINEYSIFEKNFPDSVKNDVNYLTQRIMNKIFHRIISSIREAETADQKEKISLLKEIFLMELENEKK